MDGKEATDEDTIHARACGRPRCRRGFCRTQRHNRPGLDAQSVYSAAEVGVARRAYRAQRTRYQSADVCECLTSGFAQALSPGEVRLAAAQFPVRFGRDERTKIAARRTLDRSAPGWGFPTSETRSFALERIQTLEADLAPICAAPAP